MGPATMLKRCSFFIFCLYLSLGNTLDISDCPPNVPRDRFLHIYNDSGLCYRFVVNKRVTTFWRAEKACERHGGTLVSIKTKEVNDFIWKTLERHGMKDDTWIGLSGEEKKGTFVWMDKTEAKSQYQNFDEWDHDLNVFDGHCVVIAPAFGGVWRSKECDKMHAHYVCQYTPVMQSTTMSTTTQTTTQPSTTKAPTTPSMSTPYPTCQPFVCDLACDMDGYTKDENGCTICKCDV